MPALPPAVLTEGLVLGESPRWHAGRLWVSDWGRRQILVITTDGDTEIVLEAPSFPCCFDWTPDGRMLVVAGREEALLQWDANAGLRAFAELGHLAAPPWNEVVADAAGGAYVNNTGFDFPQAPFAPGGVMHVVPDGRARQVADDLAFPNGMALADDGTTLLVAESYANAITAFDVAADGALSGRRVWAALGDGVPDGICVDAEGALWYADVPNACCVRVREGGEVLQRVQPDRGGFSCALGGADGHTLFVTANRWPGLEGMSGMLGGDPPGGQIIATTVRVPAAATAA